MNILIQKTTCGLLAVVMLFTLVFSFGSPVQAQSASSQQAQIEELLVLIVQLQARLAEMQQTTVQNTTEGGFSEKDIQIGSRVQTTDNLRVRSAAQLSAVQIAVASPFTGGTVMGGPIISGGYSWWNVQYDNGVSGWSVQNWLISVTDYSRSIARNTPIDGTQFIDNSIDWQEDIDGEGDPEDDVSWTEEQDDQEEQQDEIDDLMKQLEGISTQKETGDIISLRYNGTKQDEITVPIQDQSIKLTYHFEVRPQKCEIVRYYGSEQSKLWHDWSSDYGREVGWGGSGYGEFYAPLVDGGLLTEVTVSCQFSGTETSESIQVNVVSSNSIGEFTFIFNQIETSSVSEVTETEAYTLCQQEISDSRGRSGDVAECYWNDDLIKQTSSWKG